MAKNVISKVLEKKGIKPEELTKEEQATIDQWQKTLSSGDITLDTISAFCNQNLAFIEAQFRDLNNSHEKTSRLVLLHSVYTALRNVINAPKAERESLENYLNQLLII